MQYHRRILEYIKKRRLSTGVSLNTFSFDNEIDPANLSRYENEKTNPSLEMIFKIAKGFGQTPAEFLADFEKERFNKIK